LGRRSRQSFVKRAKEKRRQEKAALKRERRLARKQTKLTGALPSADASEGTAPEEPAAAPSMALVLVGLQNDFLPGGVVGIPTGNEVLPVANRLIAEFSRAELPIVAIRDWHPSAHCSFTDQGGRWPVHCVAETPGARFHPELRIPSDAKIIPINTRTDEDVLSGFHETDLADRLRALDVGKIVICGLATDYFVKATALDGRTEGFEVAVVQDGIRGVEEYPGDSLVALREMELAGVGIATSGTLIASLLT
jgi:nicotinamidase/pyrazinamidase